MRNRFFRGAAALAALAPLVSACAVGSAPVRPVPPAAAAGGFVTRAAGLDAARPLPDDWWRLYDDPALNALIGQALAANSDLRVAAANLRRAQAVVREARAGRHIATETGGGVAYGDAAAPVGQTSAASSYDQAQWSENAGLSLSWEVDLFGRVGRAVAAAQADAAAVEAARDAVRVTVAAETGRAYLDACALGLALEVAHGSVRTSAETRRLVAAQQRAGAVGRMEVERAAAAEATARAALPALEGQRQAVLFELAALIGATPDAVPLPARQCAAPPSPGAVLPVGDGADLIRRRPDLRQAERQVAAESARIGVASADLYPRIRLGASGSFFRNDTVRGGDSFSFALGPLLSWSFPDRSVARARLAQARAQGDAALATFDGRVLTALKEVEQALTAVAMGQQRLEALAEARDRAATAYRLADRRYRAGAASFLDRLSAQADLLTARAAHAEALRSLSSARIDLFKALGGGWRTPTPVAATPGAGPREAGG